MARDVMSVRLWLPQIRVIGVVVDAPERLAVRVASTVGRPKCPLCGTPSGRVHDRRDNRVIHPGFCAGSGDWSEHGIHGC